MLNKLSAPDLVNTIRSIRFSNHIHSLRIQTQSYENTNSAQLQTETMTMGWLTTAQCRPFKFPIHVLA